MVSSLPSSSLVEVVLGVESPAAMIESRKGLAKCNAAGASGVLTGVLLLSVDDTLPLAISYCRRVRIEEDEIVRRWGEDGMAFPSTADPAFFVPDTLLLMLSASSRLALQSLSKGFCPEFDSMLGECGDVGDAPAAVLF